MISQIELDLKEIIERVQSSWRLSGSKILITGAGGFLGYYMSSFFIKYLDDLGIKKLALVDLMNLTKTRGFQEIPGKVILLRHDMSSLTDIPLDLKEFNVIINLASFASPVSYRANPLGTLSGSVLSVWRLLETYSKYADSSGSFQIFSSSEIYGDPPASQIPTSEDYWGNVSCLGPRACYDEAKRFIETLGYTFSKEHKINVNIIRPFNNYGPGMNLTDGRLVADAMKSMVTNENVNMYSDGKPTRSFCYITDAIVGYILALNKKAFNVYNIGNDQKEISVHDYLEVCSKVLRQKTGRTMQINFQKSDDPDFLTNNPNRRFPDLTRARNDLGYSPLVTIDDGVSRWYDYEKQKESTAF